MMHADAVEASLAIVARLIPSGEDHRPTLDEFLANDEDYICDSVDSSDIRDLMRAALGER